MCLKFICLARTPKGELRPMFVAKRGNCIEIEIVGGNNSLFLTPKKHNYIFSIIDCFTRYAIAV